MLKKRKLKAFTLLELLIVLVIISILLAVAIPAIGKFQDSATKKADEMNMVAIKEAATLYMIDNNWEPTSITVDELITNNYLEENDLKKDKSIYKIEVKDKKVKVTKADATGNTSN